MTKKIVLITGASSGFGKLTALKLLASKQWHVYVASRRAEQMKDLEALGAQVLKMDVSSDSEVTSGINAIIQQHGRIDALLANAGYGSYGMVECVPMDEIKYQYEVNVFGVARTVQAVLPYMRQQKSGRIVITTSLVSHISLMGLGWYASTKHALNGMAKALRQEVKMLGIDVVTIEPGVVKTGFDSLALDNMRKLAHPDEYMPYIKGVDKYFTNAYSNCPGPENTANSMFKALTTRKPKAVYKTTADSKILSRIQAFLPVQIIDNYFISAIKKLSKQP